jgi:hypothetical protein
VVSFPIWQPLVAAGETAAPELEYPKGESKKPCVEPTEYMKANHMNLLDAWRDAVVREGLTKYTASTGETHDMSLTRTCLSCHTNRDTFCTKCHDYADVEPTCWECHVEEGGN